MADDLDRLRLLHAVARRGTIAAAARQLGFTPSAVSQQLSALERKVGVPLLERSNRGVTPTPAGAVLVEQAATLMDGLDAAVRRAIDLGGADHAPAVQIAAFPTAITSIVTPLLAADHLAVEVLDLEPDDALQALLDRRVELAVVDGYDGEQRRLPHAVEREDLLTDALRIVAPAGRSPQALGWVLGVEGGSLGIAGRAALARAGLQPRVIAQTDDHRLAFALSARLGVATVQPALALRDLPEASGLVISDRDLGTPRRVQLLRRRLPRDHPHVTAVRNALRTAAAAV